MPQRRRSALGASDVQTSEPPLNQIVQRPVGQRAKGRGQAQEQFLPRTRRSDFSEITPERLARRPGQGILVHPVELAATNPQDLARPIQITQTQMSHLAATQPMDCEQPEDGPIANVTGLVGGRAGQQSLHVGPGRTLRHVFLTEQAWSEDRFGHVPPTPTLLIRIMEKPAERFGRGGQGGSAQTSVAQVAQELIHLHHGEVAQRHGLSLPPPQKLLCPPTVPGNGSKGINFPDPAAPPPTVEVAPRMQVPAWALAPTSPGT